MTRSSDTRLNFSLNVLFGSLATVACLFVGYFLGLFF